MSSPTSQNHPSEKVSKKSLTLRSDALQKDDERPAQPPDCALQAAAEPGQKYGSMAASPYRQMKKGQRRPHGVGPKDPKHGFFGALPLRQRGRRICIYRNIFWGEQWRLWCGKKHLFRFIVVICIYRNT